MHEIGFHMSRLSRTLRVSAMPNNFTGSKAVTVQMKMKPSRLCEVLPEGWHISSQSTCFPSRAPIYHPAHSLKCLDVRSASCFPATSISVLSLHLSASRNFLFFYYMIKYADAHVLTNEKKILFSFTKKCIIKMFLHCHLLLRLTFIGSCQCQ